MSDNFESNFSKYTHTENNPSLRAHPDTTLAQDNQTTL